MSAMGRMCEFAYVRFAAMNSFSVISGLGYLKTIGITNSHQI